jgi:hypothetical protein
MRALILLALLLMAVPAWAQEIKLATWNIAWLTTKPAGHPDLPQNLTIRTEQDFARLRAYAERLAADVIALQEVDGPLAAARVFDATTYDFHFPVESDVQRTGFAWRKGLQVTRNPDLMALDLRPTARRSLQPMRLTKWSAKTPAKQRLNMANLGWANSSLYMSL